MGDQLSVKDKRRLENYIQYFQDGVTKMIGYPMAIDFDYSDLQPLLKHHINNVGDPFVDPSHVSSKEMEREVIDFYADLFRAPKNDRWGYITTGGTEGNLFALYLARRLYPTAVAYKSAASHFSIDKALDMLQIPSCTIKTNAYGEMNYKDLRRAAALHADKPAIVVANIGTTMHEARDDTATIHKVLNDAGVAERFVHSDGAFCGIPSALQKPRPPFDFADGADSLSISGHKFIGSPIPCGVVLTRRRYIADQDAIQYTAAPDTTITGSRSGHAALFMWYAIKRWGIEGFRRRAEESVALADYTEKELKNMGWAVRRHRGAFTIMMAAPPDAIRKEWQLATENGWCHLICAPGVSRTQIDAFLQDLQQIKK
jgi:histidine decarboxylase